MISKTMIFDEVALGLRVRGIDEKEVKERVIETLKPVVYIHIEIGQFLHLVLDRKRGLL